MGHMVGKDLYRRLGKKIDNLTARAPWNDTLREILTELYTPREAELVVKMPYGLATLEQVEKTTGFERAELQRLLDDLAEKGLVLDIWLGDHYRYTISPLIIGIFEFTLMRTRGELNTKEWARMFHDYLSDGGTYHRANFSKGQTISPLRTLPYEDAIAEDAFVEILDYEKASAIIDGYDRFAIGICSCRHEKMHAGEKKCDVPLETCSSFGHGTDSMIRHGFARDVSKSEMLDNLARSKDLGLVLCADNVKKDVSFICHCCGCCCNVLLGVSQFGYPNVVVSSNYIAKVDDDECQQCGVCVESCPVNAISQNGDDDLPVVDEKVCLGCGVCALNCTSDSLKLVKRDKRVFYPEDTFERVILQSLEQGTLQNLLFNNPQSTGQGFMRGVVGGFLKLPPIKRALMSDSLRSRFLTTLKRGG
jgi:Pyruvate/2-oxoacid:ferredoxin oxidoreductase delta subunit